MSDFDDFSITLPDGYATFARFWPVSKPRGAVLYHHGIQSHCGWYEASARALVDAGFAVLQVDRRGSGRSDTDRGHAESAEQLIGDALAGRDALRQRTGLRAYHVVGVSWGGKLAVAAYVTEPAGVQSLSLVTPGLFPLVGVSKETAQEIGIAMIYEPQRRFPIPLNEPALFTSDPTWQAFFRDDPLTLRACSAAFYLASRRMDKTIAGLSSASAVPIHLFVAGNEQIIDSAKTIDFINGLDWPQVQISTYARAKHSLEFEDVQQDFLRSLTGFVGAVG